MSPSVEGGVPPGPFDFTSMQAGLAAAGGAIGALALRVSVWLVWLDIAKSS